MKWWEDNSLAIGKLSEREIRIRIVNLLTYEEDLLTVPKEEILSEIVERYSKMNSHALSFTWKDVDGKLLNMGRNLSQNGLLEGLDDDDEGDYFPTILIYFNDDLT